jgi:type II secretory pathway pseudopilin PulG
MRSRTERSERGFTLIEGLVTLLIVTVIIIGLLTLLDRSTRLAKQETQVADAQGGGRSAVYEVTRLIRQARVGNLSPQNALMPFVNNATSASPKIGGRTIREGTDAIEVRGVLFGESYHFDTGDVSCPGGPCDGNQDTVSVTIRQITSTGYENFATGRLPELANRTQPFYFVVSSTNYQVVTGKDASGGTAPQALPSYYVGRVDADDTGTWYTSSAGPPGTFQFTVNFTDESARTLNATNLLDLPLQTPFSGGAVDDVILFVDEGPDDPAGLGGAKTHPFLAQAVLRPNGSATPSVEVQRLIDDVEDLQFAYGIDGIDSSTPDRGVDPTVTSAAKDGDEWVFNANGETLTPDSTPKRYDVFIAGPAGLVVTPSTPIATEALRAVYVAVVTKSLDPDFTFKGPGGLGVKTFDSTAKPVSSVQPYRRRIQTMAVNLRNYL